MLRIIYFLILTSFCLCCYMKIEKNENYIYGRSRCDHCYHKLKIKYCIPIISYIFLKGKCPYCHKKIKKIHFIIEVLTLIISLFLPINHFVELIDYSILIILLLLSFIDFKYYVVPIVLQILLSFYILIYRLIIPIHNIDPIINITMICGVMIITNFIVKDSFGDGDISLMLILSFYQNSKIMIIGFIISILIGGIVSLVIKSTKRKIKILPFVPILISGLYISIPYHEMILKWYFSL